MRGGAAAPHEPSATHRRVRRLLRADDAALCLLRATPPRAFEDERLPDDALLARLCASAGDATPAPRTLIVCAHPDDEVLGAGGRFARLAAGLHVLHLTDGAPRAMGDAHREGFATREDYARARRREVEAALAAVGVPPTRALELGSVDQEASLDLAGLALRAAEAVRRIAPEAVLAPAYEGGHPDHDAAAFVAWCACALAGTGTAPALFEFPLYHAPVAGAGPYELLPSSAGAALAVELGQEERALKERLFALHRTQQVVLSTFPPGPERFRRVTRPDFSRAPHAGRLHYEDQPWGMTGARWRALAAEALVRLRLAP